MKILNLYAGIGGNRKLWGDEHKITAVENNIEVVAIYKQLFSKDTVIVEDAHEYLLKHHTEYDFIWSSPPCPTHSRMAKARGIPLNKYPDMRLYQEIIFLQHFFKGLFVVENVIPYYEPLIYPTKEIGRHYFWSNFKISNFEQQTIKGFIKKDDPKSLEKLKNWLGLQFDKNVYLGNGHSPAQILRNCVHPETGLHILNCAMNKKTIVNNQQTLF